MNELIQGKIDETMAALLSTKEKQIRDCLDDFLGRAWTLKDVKRRMSRRIDTRTQIETIWLDGRPILEFHPLEFSYVRRHDGYVQTVTQKYRRLP